MALQLMEEILHQLIQDFFHQQYYISTPTSYHEHKRFFILKHISTEKSNVRYWETLEYLVL